MYFIIENYVKEKTARLTTDLIELLFFKIIIIILIFIALVVRIIQNKGG